MILVTQHSEPGDHPDNQDVLVTAAHPLDSTWHLAAVADGMGGQPGAFEAAQLACRTFLRRASTLAPRELAQPGSWVTVLRAADSAITADSQAGFSTLAAVGVTATTLLGDSCGDSAVVLFSGGRPMQILTDAQRKNPPVGSGEAEFVPFGAALTPPWTVLLLTDGVWKYVGWDFLAGLDPHQPGEQLIRLTRARATLRGAREPDTYRGLQDDFTLVVLQGTP